ncbi:MarR family transcriptional regulator [Streptomyces finlayi]|uniref:MarR family transcriptional regulator n=1 Tax=Streptomyces finlayi TaxID=67296 RepID=A0A7G7BFI1_9ACTN|nr:MarR family transcriptional regulator [Streptomyces finlayi]QNE74096.1 MarR family transcriptional regulator [Streptomyces finlayi]
MATTNISPALRPHASPSPYPMAKPGYGKRSTPDQAPRQAEDFALLPERERYIASFVDRLPEGAAMTVKTLAKQLPRYGQQAVGTALTALSVAGHLRRVRRPAGVGDQVRWVFRTFWSRTARDNEWWAAFIAAEDGKGVAAVRETTPAPAPAPAPVVAVVAVEPPAPQPGHSPSPAYRALAQLGCRDARLALSAEDCVALEGLAAEWLARGASAEYLAHALTAGLPEAVDVPRGFVRRRLRDKMPPRLTTPTAAPVRRTMVECTACGVPGRPEALPDGLCRACRPTLATAADCVGDRPVGRDVHALVDQLRGLARTP